MLERQIEKKVCEKAKLAGWLTYKWVSPSQAGVPDRIFIRDGEIIFIEFKAFGKKPTELQKKTIEKLKGQKMKVYICDSIESACNALSL